MAELRIKEIYRSIQGESTFAGWPCVFVRTAGCDIRCGYCDEAHAFTGGERLSIESILDRVARLGIALVEVTGGEPLAQPEAPALIAALCSAGHEVLVETGGHRDISAIAAPARRIVDVKTPGSEMSAHNRWENLDILRAGDEVKFVLCDRADYEWSCAVIRERDLVSRVPVHLSPVHPGLAPEELTAWMLDDALGARLNLQLHKYVWGPDAKGV